MTQQANALREKLKSRQSKADSINKCFPSVMINAENNIFSKETNETENNKILTKISTNNFTKNLFSNANSKNNIFNSLNNEENKDLNQNNILNYSIKVGLDVELDESGSTPGLSEILDSDNDLNLNESEIKKLIKKNLAKHYDFKQDEDIKNQLWRLKQKNKTDLEAKNFSNKDLNNNNINGNSNIPNSKNHLNQNFIDANKKSAIEANDKTKTLFCSPTSNQKEKCEESPKRKKYIGELIRFDSSKNNGEKKNLAKIKDAAEAAATANNKHKNLKINTNENLHFTKEDTEEENYDENDEISIASDNSLMKQAMKLYNMHQKGPELLNVMNNKKLFNLNHLCSEKKLKTKSYLKANYDNDNFSKGLCLDDKINRRDMLMSDFKNSNFFHKFKLFEKNNFKNKNNSANNYPNLRNSSYDNLYNNNNKSSNKQNKIFLTAKEKKQKKLDELYVRNINYDKILKKNLEMMKNLFPEKKGKKASKDFINFRSTHNGFSQNINEENIKNWSRNNVLGLESNENTESVNTHANNNIYSNNNNINYNTNNNNVEINIRTDYECNEETINNSNNERNEFKRNKNFNKMNTGSNGIFIYFLIQV